MTETGKTFTPEKATVEEEIDAIAAVYESLRLLDKESQRRVMRWVADRLGHGVPTPY